MATVELKSITKVYDGNVTAVKDANITVEDKEFVVLVGPSGCGKTTTLRMIAGFEHATSGSIELEGRDISSIAPHKRNMPMVFQSYALFPHMTIQDNIAYGLKLRNVPREQIVRDVDEACRMVNLEGVSRRYPGELSGGQQQRVALARALVLKPEIILFDEPLSNLDAKLRIQTRTEIKRVQQSMGVTALYVTHDQSEALSLSDTIVIMNHGRIAQSGSPEEVYNNPASPFVSDFIGNANFLEGTVLEKQGASLLVECAGRQLTVPEHRCEAGIEPGGTVRVAIKPEMIRVKKETSDFPVVVDVAAFVGPITEYKLQFRSNQTTSGGGHGVQLVTAIESNLEGQIRVYHAGEEVFMHFQGDQVRLYKE